MTINEFPDGAEGVDGEGVAETSSSSALHTLSEIDVVLVAIIEPTEGDDTGTAELGGPSTKVMFCAPRADEGRVGLGA